MWKGVLLWKQAINTEMYILNPLKDKSHFTIMAGDPMEKVVIKSLSTLIEKHGELRVQKAAIK